MYDVKVFDGLYFGVGFILIDVVKVNKEIKVIFSEVIFEYVVGVDCFFILMLVDGNIDFVDEMLKGVWKDILVVKKN